MTQHTATTTPAYQAIVKAAFTLFYELGYEGTTYELIAQKAHTKKTNVQYYFPKKKALFLLLIERLLDEVYDRAETLILTENHLDEHTKISLMGLIYYAVLLSDDKSCRLTYEAISHRDVTSELLTTNANWASRSIAFIRDSEHYTERFMPAHIISTGGVYEYLYYSIGNGIAVDPLAVINLHYKAFNPLASQDMAVGDPSKLEHSIDKERMSSLVKNIRSSLLA